MFARIALRAYSLVAFIPTIAAACEGPCLPGAPCMPVDKGPSWIFNQSTYSHDPETGVRVAQYSRLPAIEPLEDQRMVTSRYRRSRTNLRGTQGSFDTYYEVQAWGNGRGGIDAEWERFHDAWKESYLQNGYYNVNPSFGSPWGHSGFWPGFGWGQPGWGFPGGGFPNNGHGGNWPGNGHGGGKQHGGGHE